MENQFQQWVSIKKKQPEDLLSLIHDGDDLILPIANGEPQVLIDIIEENADKFQNVRIHQMHAVKERAYIQGKRKPSLSYVSYFLSRLHERPFYKDSVNSFPIIFTKFLVFCVNRQKRLLYWLLHLRWMNMDTSL